MDKTHSGLKQKVEAMDKIPDKEFMEIFERSTEYINFRGCVSPDDVEGRMKKVQKAMLKIEHKAKLDRTKKYWHKRRMAIKKLRDHRFQERMVFEAAVHPQQKISLTLQYGLANAKKILLNRKRRRTYRIRRRIV